MKFFGIITMLFLVSCGFQSHAGNDNHQKNIKTAKGSVAHASQYIADELLVKFVEGTPEPMAQKRIADKGAVVLNMIKQQGVYHIRLPKGQSAKEQLATYKSVEGVEFVEFNYIRGLQ